MNADSRFDQGLTIRGCGAVVGIMLLGLIGPSVLAQTPIQLEDAKLVPNDGAAGDQFGYSVAISGTTAIVGARLDDDNGASSGSAYLFDITTGQLIAKLLPDDGVEIDIFGHSVAVSGTTAIVGAIEDDDNGSGSGSAYLFDTTTGQQIAKLLPSDGAAGDKFGYSVAISGATAIVGARDDDDNGVNSGSAYLFDTTTGQQIAKLLPNDGGGGFHGFGFSVAISGTIAIVGVPGDDIIICCAAGSAYLFDTTTGQQIAKLLPNDPAHSDRFGYSVAISGTTAIAGARGDNVNGAESGSAYLFDTTTGEQIAKLVPDDGAASDTFGFSVAISGTIAIVGAVQDGDNGPGSGSAYLFDTTTGEQIAKLLASDGAADDFFGWSIAIGGPAGNEVAIVGTFDDSGVSSGSAYVFDVGILDAIELLFALIDTVIDLNLQQGIENGLDAKLDAVLGALQDINENNDGAAINALQAFISAVQAQSGNHIPVEDANDLIARAQEVIDLLSL